MTDDDGTLDRVIESLGRMAEDRKLAIDRCHRMADALRLIAIRSNCCDTRARQIARDALKNEGYR